ncbi:dihydrofolate reductase family protein [Solirubrobacter ginsenosidimutans]|uniref:Dihydrofolate reductase family protein n=1 Tax=Solirubrobacter ginsenosidimutans TaxID=490573 RepID=A0A9X3S4R5_9ACTN|nr:dihydrofolate reductase family protein [Solirubrobacter ginsenosidimutans]MDA0166109.1 dihydrofolate reductase family protein [Solirubrobacter ginsenosidimutans]
MSSPAGLRPTSMTKTYTGASMSLDGYISGPDESGFDLLFDWYNNGDVVIETAREDLTMRCSPQSAAYFREVMDTAGAFVVGRHLFDITNGWEGRHPIDIPVVVVTHEPPTDWQPKHRDHRFEFVTEGVEAAVARARVLAGDKAVVVNGGQMARQALEAGLIDELWVDLVPVLLGGGRPLFDHVKGPVTLDGPLSVVEGDRVTHLRYTVRR